MVPWTTGHIKYLSNNPFNTYRISTRLIYRQKCFLESEFLNISHIQTSLIKTVSHVENYSICQVIRYQIRRSFYPEQYCSWNCFLFQVFRVICWFKFREILNLNGEFIADQIVDHDKFNFSELCIGLPIYCRTCTGRSHIIEKLYDSRNMASISRSCDYFVTSFDTQEI